MRSRLRSAPTTRTHIISLKELVRRLWRASLSIAITPGAARLPLSSAAATLTDHGPVWPSQDKRRPSPRPSTVRGPVLLPPCIRQWRLTNAEVHSAIRLGTRRSRGHRYEVLARSLLPTAEACERLRIEKGS